MAPEIRIGCWSSQKSVVEQGEEVNNLIYAKIIASGKRMRAKIHRFCDFWPAFAILSPREWCLLRGYGTGS